MYRKSESAAYQSPGIIASRNPACKSETERSIFLQHELITDRRSSNRKVPMGVEPICVVLQTAARPSGSGTVFYGE